MRQLLLFLIASLGASAVEYPGPPPGAAQATVTAGRATLGNAAVQASWTWSNGKLKPERLVNKEQGGSAGVAECFTLILGQTPLPNPRTVKASEMKLVGTPEMKIIAANPKAVRLADRFTGKEISARLISAELEVRWRAVLRDGSNYIRQEVSIAAVRDPVEVVEAVLVEARAPGAEVVGRVDGSPVVAGQWFFGVEHPGSTSSTPEPGLVRCSYPYNLDASRGAPLTMSAVAGVFPKGQRRRGFLYYLERERAYPYRPFLHHNNGEQIGLTYWEMARKRPAEAAAYRAAQEETWRKMIEGMGRELVDRRGVKLDAFVHDYDWDDENLVWQFHNGYPDGFTPLAKIAARYHSKLGIWFSPWGGYPCKPARVKFGRQQGLETNQGGLSLAGPRYYARFRAACLNLMRLYGLNYYKFDGFAGSNSPPGAGEYRSDVEALWRLMGELRRAMPSVFLNPSSGTWASPFWLLRSDSIWRGGGDAGVAGSKGSERQQWITYRDFEVHNRVVAGGPLFPITSLMIHGIMINKGARVKSFVERDMIDEIRSFFATGANVQELYVDEDLMTPATWDAIAEGAKWSRANSAVLADNHWVGGDPGKNEVYGWAAWSAAKGVLTLRNPSDELAELTFDIGAAFELPAGAVKSWSLRSPWKKDAQAPALKVAAGSPHRFRLQPFELMTFEATPVR